MNKQQLDERLFTIKHQTKTKDIVPIQIEYFTQYRHLSNLGYDHELSQSIALCNTKSKFMYNILEKTVDIK